MKLKSLYYKTEGLPESNLGRNVKTKGLLIFLDLGMCESLIYPKI